ncbi:MAG: peptide ABC transporter permease [Clostridia bacterium BRH_c25]|nr:MAG: peptide ABC transporter permease [Clostridia bacterium BRH_c25]
MVKYVFNRILQIIPVVLGITVLVFFIMRMIPGDPAMVMLGQDATPEDIARIRAILGLDRNIFVQLFSYIKNMLMLDFGNSIFLRQPVLEVIKASFPATIELAVTALIISLIIAVPLGIISAVKQNSWVDYTSMAFAQLGISMPVFWTGVLLILLFSVKLGWLPSFGRGESIIEGLKVLVTTGSGEVLLASLKKLILPAASLGIMGSAMISRMIRSTMLEVLDSDYVRTARAKGTVERKVIMKHAFRNALLPVVTIVGLQFGTLLGGSIITESVFAWPGIGRIIVTAISQRDFPLVQGGVIFLATTFAVMNLLVDVLYVVINPKIRH